MELHDIGWAVRKIRLGEKVYRTGWNGQGMWIALSKPVVSSAALPYVYIYTTDRHTIPWLCSQTDLLAEDWELVKHFDE